MSASERRTLIACTAGFLVISITSIVTAPILNTRGTFYCILGAGLAVLAFLAEDRLEWQRKHPKARTPTDWEFWACRLNLLLGLTTIGIQFVIRDVRASLPVEVSLALDARNALGYGACIAGLLARLEKARETRDRIEREHAAEVIYGGHGRPENQRPTTMHRNVIQ